MIKLVSAATAREQLHLDNDMQADWLDMAIAGVSAAVVAWVGGIDRLAPVDSSGNPTIDSDGVVEGVDGAAVLAVLVEIAYQYRFREGAAEQNQGDWFKPGYVLNMSSTALLTPLRQPVVR